MSKKSVNRIIVLVLIAAVICVAAILICTSKTIKFDTNAVELEYTDNLKLPTITATVTSILGKYNGTKVEAVPISDFDSLKLGEQTVEYKATFKNAIATEQVKVYISDNVSPTITLTGGDSVILNPGVAYVELGYAAEDNHDGDITDKVTITSTDVQVTYSVRDESGNTTSVTRTITHKQNTVVDPGKNVIYLTFDDGPGPYTEKLLDILDKYNVKVTFFVTNNRPGYNYLIGEEAKRGHTVAVHSYTHSYAKVYTSEEAYFEDFDKMNEIIYQQTGKYATLFRFPGGSSNTVSKKYSTGIMTRLVALATQKGLRYTDWNVTSGDAGNTNETAKVVENVINGVTKRNGKYAIVLQHDIKSFSVDAVEEIIQWGLANGYTFLPMTDTSPVSHHGIAN